MILKIIEKDENGYEMFNLYDNVVCASVYFNKQAKTNFIRAYFKDSTEGSDFPVNIAAYIMNDVGETVERVYSAKTSSE